MSTAQTQKSNVHVGHLLSSTAVGVLFGIVIAVLTNDQENSGAWFGASVLIVGTFFTWAAAASNPGPLANAKFGVWVTGVAFGFGIASFVAIATS